MTKLIRTLVSLIKVVGDLDYFLGIEVTHHADGSLTLTQSKYLRDLLAKTNIDEANPIAPPMVGGCKLSKSSSERLSNPTLYISMVGALQYATITRPEINFSINEVCQFMFNPLEKHCQVVKRILRHLNGSITLD